MIVTGMRTEVGSSDDRGESMKVRVSRSFVVVFGINASLLILTLTVTLSPTF